MAKQNELTITSDALPLSITITLKVKKGKKKERVAVLPENPAKDFLLSYFAANGSKDKLVSEIWKVADEAGIPRKAVYQASKELGVVKRLIPHPDGERGGIYWTWTAPTEEPST